MLFDIIFYIVPIFIFIISITIIIKGISQWKYNNSQPTLMVSAKLISKRANVSTTMHNHPDGVGTHFDSSTSYYLTFEVEGGSRLEFHVGGHEFGLLVEGDTGKLKFQGTRYLGFDRQ
ncbi:DUF2500 domain-containing protein [Clostridiaceae bacterium UIB06]|uniref:DUF2500 domain-containing protein n=1 Tax=Clostridium thailandense TaxID=2794346 RepID=A0A949X3A9_9CLOT|nr:DUF2500 domain-containing protein [Clostridium thailandense]MBV7274264.1 DUF2500 domain-containing protein [Clostridium thailandense]MCH5136164.1 DUF2500 domain-containing protein [Clostridiaceae bacterium UIB06]